MNTLADLFGPSMLYGFGSAALFSLGWWTGQCVREVRAGIRRRRIAQALREVPQGQRTWDAHYRQPEHVVRGKANW